MNISFIPLNTTQPYINLEQQCPDALIIYKQWGTAFIILFAIMVFSLLTLYIVMDILLNKEKEKNKKLLELKQC